jgi:hypothetical protein
MNRRHFLQTLSGTALSFPWFSNLALHGAEATKAPRRLVCIGLDFGVRPESFFPATHGPELELTPLLTPLERWRQKMTVFSQLEHPGVQGGHYGVHAFLSGVRREQAAGFKDGCVTLDQMVEEHLGGLTRFPSLCLGVGSGDAISWTRSGIAVPKLEDPGVAFDMLFKPQRKSAAAARRAELSENESVLALIAEIAGPGSVEHGVRAGVDAVVGGYTTLAGATTWLESDKSYPNKSPVLSTGTSAVDAFFSFHFSGSGTRSLILPFDGQICDVVAQIFSPGDVNILVNGVTVGTLAPGGAEIRRATGFSPVVPTFTKGQLLEVDLAAAPVGTAMVRVYYIRTGSVL